MKQHSKGKIKIILSAVAIFTTFFVTRCGSFTSKKEYWLYRNLMEEKDIGKKAELYVKYIRNYPDGKYYKQVKSITDAIELDMYDATGMDKSKIERYLELFPHGKFVADAKDKLVQIDALEKLRKQQALARKLEMKRKMEMERRRAEKMKNEISGSLADWPTIAESGFLYGMTVNDVAKISKRFLELWGGEPIAKCSVDTCTKTYNFGYHFKVVGGTRIDREIQMVVMLKFMKDAKLWGISVNFVGRGFVGLREIIEGYAHEFTPEEVNSSMDFALDIVKNTVKSLVPEGKTTKHEGATFAYQTLKANFYVTRREIGGGKIVDSLLIQLLPEPPEEQVEVKGKKKLRKKKKLMPPPPPIIEPEKLIYIPIPVESKPAVKPHLPHPQAPAQPFARPAPSGAGSASPPPPELPSTSSTKGSGKNQP